MEKINFIHLVLRLLMALVMILGSAAAHAQLSVTYIKATGVNDPVAPNYLLTDFQNSIQIGTSAGFPSSYLAGCTPMAYAAPLNTAKNKAIYQFLTMAKLSGQPVSITTLTGSSSPYSCLITGVESYKF